MPNGSSIVRQREEGAAYTHLFGTVTGSDGKPLAGATVDVWHDAPDGFYDSQTPEKPEFHCRGRFETDKEGKYSCICLKPTPYPIPYDGPAGQLLTMMDRKPFRPAHIHVGRSICFEMLVVHSSWWVTLTFEYSRCSSTSLHLDIRH